MVQPIVAAGKPLHAPGDAQVAGQGKQRQHQRDVKRMVKGQPQYQAGEEQGEQQREPLLSRGDQEGGDGHARRQPDKGHPAFRAVKV